MISWQASWSCALLFLARTALRDPGLEILWFTWETLHFQRTTKVPFSTTIGIVGAWAPNVPNSIVQDFSPRDDRALSHPFDPAISPNPCENREGPYNAAEYNSVSTRRK